MTAALHRSTPRRRAAALALAAEQEERELDLLQPLLFLGGLMGLPQRPQRELLVVVEDLRSSAGSLRVGCQS